MPDITWTNDTRKLRDLIPWKRNPREINKREAERLGDSLAEFGQIQTIAIDPDNTICDGHQRKIVWSLLPQFGPDYEVDVRVASRPLTEKERQKLVVFLHQGTVGQWNWDELANSFELPELLEWGFEEAELQLDWGSDEPTPDPGAQVDKAAELQEKWQVKKGDVWIAGRHRVMCGDSTSAEDVAMLMGGGKAALLWTDPLYHVGKIFEGDLHEGNEWDALHQNSWLLCAMDVLREGAQRYICFAQARSRDAILTYEPKRLLVWCKPFALMRANAWDWAYEFVAWCYDTDEPDYFDKPEGTASFDWQEIPSVIHGHEGRHHITQKPVELPLRHIQASCPTDGMVLDLFLGSGTTMIAAEQIGRSCRGMEIEPRYVSVCLERLAGMGLEPRLCE